MLIEIKGLIETYFTTIFDESLNKIFQRGQIGILIRFCDENNKKVDTSYFDSLFLDGDTTTDIHKPFMSRIKELDKNNFLQISSDGPNKNFKILELMAGKRKTEAFTTYRNWNLWTAYSLQQSKSRNQIVLVDCRESHESYIEIT